MKETGILARIYRDYSTPMPDCRPERGDAIGYRVVALTLIVIAAGCAASAILLAYELIHKRVETEKKRERERYFGHYSD